MSALYNPDGLSKIPADIRNQRLFLVWQWLDPDVSGKRKKLPYYVNGSLRSTNNSVLDRESLVTLDEALTRAADLDPHRARWGVGMAFTSASQVIGIDYDWVVGADGDKEPAVVGGKVHPSIRREISGTYYEVSPSGKGVHALFAGHSKSGKFNRELPVGIPSREVFGHSGFLTLTGHGCGSQTASPLPELPPTIARLLEPLERLNGQPIPDPEELTIDEIRKKLFDPVCSSFANKYDPWLKVGMALHFQYGGDTQGMDLWDEWSRVYSGKAYNQAEIVAKWDSFHVSGSHGSSPVTLNTVDWLIRRAYREQDTFDDLTTVLAAVDAAERAQDEVDMAAGTEPAPPVIPPLLMDVDAFSIKAKSAGYIVKGLIEKKTIGFIAGQPGAGKSFIALHLLDCILRNVPFFGYDIGAGPRDETTGKQRPLNVCYVAAEGQSGVVKRLGAIATRQGLTRLSDAFPSDRVVFKPEALSWMSDEASAHLPNGQPLKEYVRLALECKRRKIDIIIFDTHAACAAGVDENSNSETQEIVKRMDLVRRYCDATILSVHHAPKNGTGLRGASALLGAADFVLEAYITEAGYRRFRQVKAKDDMLMKSCAYDLSQVTLADEYQPDLSDISFDIATSCVIVEDLESEEEDSLGAEAYSRKRNEQSRTRDFVSGNSLTDQLRAVVVELAGSDARGYTTKGEVVPAFRSRVELSYEPKHINATLRNLFRNLEPLVRNGIVEIKGDRILPLSFTAEPVADDVNDW